MDRAFYSQYGDRWDEGLFREMIQSHLTADSVVLDLGAGRGRVAEMGFRGQCAFIAGVDPDPSVMSNPLLDEAKVLAEPDFRIPYPDEQFDLVFSDSVLEHVSSPGFFFAEVARVLKPGGVFLAKTPNKYHYVTTIARMTPHWFHEFVNRLRGRDHADTFPTVYRCNSRRCLVQESATCGLRVSQVRIVEGRPEYLRFNFLAYIPGLIYERIVNCTSLFERFRCVLLADMRKC